MPDIRHSEKGPAKPARVARLRHPQRRAAYLAILVASTAIAAASCWAMIVLAR